MSILQPHPYADLLPMMSDAEYRSLRDDIAANGQSDRALVYQGKLLDGRNRQRACDELGIKLEVEMFKGSDVKALQRVYSRANHRNMTESQKAAAAVNFLPHFERHAKARMAAGGGDKRSGTAPVPDPSITGPNGMASDQAGSLFGVSGRYVRDAKLIAERDPKLFRDVFEGRVVITRAKQIVRRNESRDRARKAARRGTAASIDDCEIIVGDCGQIMPALPRRKFRLIFADPPYNLGFKYDGDPTRDALEACDYRARTLAWITECVDLLTPDGTLCWMVPEEWVADVGIILRDAGLHVRRLIVWHESFGQAGVNNFGRTCRFIWYATKSKTDFVFDAASILIDSKRATQYGDKRAMPGGKVPDAMWDFSRLCGTFGERIPDEGIPTQLPIALVQRAVKCFTGPGDTVFDPFGGTGTTTRAAISLGRKCVTIERSKRYAAVIKRELANLVSQGGRVIAARPAPDRKVSS